MRRRNYLRAAVAALIGCGLAAGLARAGEPAAPAAVEPWEVIERGSAQPVAAPEPPKNPAFTHKGPVRDYVHDCMHKIGVGCWSHHNMYTCSSFHSEFTFVFGSCREFFGEPCLPGPPVPPMPPGYGPPPTYLPQPGYGAAPNYNALYAPGYGRGGCPNCQ